MAHKIYDNFYLSNEVEDQYNSVPLTILWWVRLA